MPPEEKIDPRVFELYDEYCHGYIDRRTFLSRAAAITIGGVSALSMAQALLPRYAEAQTISFTDRRIKGTYVEYPSPGGNSGTMRGYLVQPTGDGPFPAVIIFHENRGLNPYIEDVARRAAVAGFLALAPDGLAPIGGYPGNDDDGRTMQRSLDREKLDQDMNNSARFLKGHALSNGRLGATGFCWGGGMTNRLAVALGGDLDAGVPYYGATGRERGRAEDRGGPHDRLRGDRPAHQRHVAGVRGSAQCERRNVRDAHVRGNAPRFPQQLDAPVQRDGGGAGVEPYRRLLP